jgi:hypothetical protein
MELVGLTAPFTGTTFTVQAPTLVAPGSTYKFRIRAQNIHGWSTWSSPAFGILAATTPAKMGIATITDGSGTLTTVRVQWTKPDERGASISEYKVLFTDKAGTGSHSVTECVGTSNDAL